MFQFDNEHRKVRDIYIYLPLAILALLGSILTVRDLEWDSHISTGRGIILFFCGLVFFTSLYLALNVLFLHTPQGRRISKIYKLTYGDVIDISNKEVSAVQALFCCITGVTCVCYSCNRNALRSSHYISEAYGWFGAAYFLYDIWSMYMVFAATHVQTDTGSNSYFDKVVRKAFMILAYLKHNAMIVGHHIFIGGFGFLVITSLRGDFGDCFFGFVYLMEASTPFVSLRGILSKIGMKNHPVYVMNGLIMLVVFFICRIAMFPYTIYVYSRTIGTDFISAIQTLPKGCLVSILILLIPQIYWFHLMLIGATKVIKKSASNNNNLRNVKNVRHAKNK
ncbi:unnamed protein product [Acanthoscelides obtectus]|uniref:TLC domain-containing protein n=1 Tax=Acanthoscelides obtectus TaxID=200917 RepID=A0A9P0PUT4_ACAOB|nr:unnamed protein product [Acanthoscelides obtectus]CAK1660772.1 Protein FAM57A [Acanthoscelides obtectus]